ncbi:MAG: methyl-accepting chemotaxis protein [Bacillota bacterium]
MKDLKIKFKLYGLSGALLIALVVVGIISLSLMSKLNEGTTIVSANWLPSVIIAEELNTATSDFRIAETSHVVSQDNATMQEHEQTIATVKSDISSMFSEYSTTLITNDTDKALIERASTLWNQYLSIHEQMITYSKNNDTTSAMEIMENESEQVFNEVSGVFLELVAFNKNGADQASLDGDNLYSSTIILLSVIMGAVAITSMLFSTYVVNMITKPIREIEDAAADMSQGVLTAKIDYTSKDELGNLSTSMRDLCGMFQDMISDLSYLLESMANGDFTIKSKRPDLYVGDFSPLIEMTNMISEQLSETLAQINEASGQVATGSTQVATTSQILAQGSIQQSESVEQLSETLQRIEEQTTLNADNAILARNESEKSKEDIIQSSKKMEAMINSMNDINTKSNEISKIIKVIDDIAFQTNILALNAAVEAARAGQAGKGFAVVADEVRNLASKSAESAQNTAKLIEETMDAVNIGVALADETGQAIDEVVEVVESVTELIEQIASASEQQRTSVIKITDDVQSISGVVRSNSASTEESAATSEELSTQSSLLKSLVAKFEYSGK